MKRRIIVTAFVSVLLLVIFGVKIMLPSHAFIGAEISDPSGDAPSEFDIVSVSFEEDGGYLTIEYRVSGNMSQAGYFIFFDVDRNPNTGCNGYEEMASGIGPEYFIFFNPITYPRAVLCSSYRPWTVVKGDNCSEFRYHQDSFVVFTEFTVRDLGLSRGEEVMIDVAASTYMSEQRDRAPDTGVVTITIFSQDEHDLSVSLKAPELIKLGESAFLYATVKNVGLENETNVELQLLIDGIVANSTATPGLNVGCSEQVNYWWTPTASGTYQVKAYAPPVLGEEFMVDNIATGNPRVRQFATVFVDPPTIEGKVIGENVTVNINVSNATDLYGWQAGLTFNPDVLNCTGYCEGEFLGIGADPELGTIWVNQTPPWDNTEGIAYFHGCCILGPLSGVNGRGQLGYLTFEVIGTGVSDLHLTDVILCDSKAEPIPHEVVDSFTVSWEEVDFSVETISNLTGTWGESSSGLFNHTFTQTEKEISFDVITPYDNYYNVTIPTELLSGDFTILIDNVSKDYILTQNATHTSLYFTHSHSTHNIKIKGTTTIPEFQLFMLMPLFMIATLLAAIVYRGEQSKLAPRKSCLVIT